MGLIGISIPGVNITQGGKKKELGTYTLKFWTDLEKFLSGGGEEAEQQLAQQALTHHVDYKAHFHLNSCSNQNRCSSSCLKRLSFVGCIRALILFDFFFSNIGFRNYIHFSMGSL